LRLRILTFTALYPNKIKPSREFSFISGEAPSPPPREFVEVIAPVAYFPSWLPVPRWRQFSEIPHEEELTPSRPPSPVSAPPGVSMLAHGMLMYLGSLGLARCLHDESDLIALMLTSSTGWIRRGPRRRRLGLPVIVSARGTDINLYHRFVSFAECSDGRC